MTSTANLSVPTPRQLEFQSWELGVFLHFGIRTFYEGHRDWDGRPMEPVRFNPTSLDCEQWVKTAKEAGFKYMVLTAKHHDGFANWPTRFTDFSVAASPWKNGQGNVVAEYLFACHKHGMKAGIYYSPADWSCPVYDDPAAYDDYFIDQISEILTGHGQVDILWFDGCGSESHEYDWPRIIREIRRMQPGLLIFNMGDPDYRWIGNEDGVADSPLWNVTDTVPFSVQTDRAETVAAGGGVWLPAECNCRMRVENWFYEEADIDTVKSIEELMGMYYLSVGRGANFLINIGPDRRGLLPEPDATRLKEFGAEIRRRFSNPVYSTTDFARDGDSSWIYRPEAPQLIDHIVLMEDVARGESVRQFEIVAGSYLNGKPVRLWQGHNIGHKAICHFPAIRASWLRVQVLKAEGPVTLHSIEAFQTAR